MGVVTTQPWFPFAAVEQSVELMSVLVWRAFDEWVHPSPVCSAIWFIVTWFTPSNVSICPRPGQRLSSYAHGRACDIPRHHSASPPRTTRMRAIRSTRMAHGACP